MAILPNLPGVEASVLIEGSLCAEFLSSDDPGIPSRNRAVQYVQSQAGAHFSIKLRLMPEYPHTEYDLRADVFVDGSVARSCILARKAQIGLAHDFELVVKGSLSQTETEQYVHRFRFANLLISDRTLNASEGDLVNKVRGLGDITIILWRVKIKGPSPATPRAHNSPVNDLNDIPEEALKGKALSQRTVFDAPERIAFQTTVDVDWVDHPNVPLATFTFRYRSSDDLKIMHIIPRTPTPVPLEDRPVEELTPAELRELLHRERARNAVIKKERTKRERSHTVTDNKGQPSRKRRADAEDDIIDLT